MEKSNLIAVLRSLSRPEHRELRKWAQSPAHNQRQDVADLLDYLLAGQHLAEDRFLAKEKAFEAVYPGQAYNDAELRQVMHFLLKLTENFLLYQELLQDEVRAQVVLARVYRKRQLPKLYTKAMDAGMETQQQQPHRNHRYYENEYLLQMERYAYLSGLGRNVPLNLQEVSDANDLSFLANKLQLSCMMLSHQAVYKTTYDFRLLPEAISYIEANPAYLAYPALAIYYYSYMAINNPGQPAFFQKLKSHLTDHAHLFPPQEMRVIYLLSINYCIGRINAGDSSFYRETFDLFNQGMERQYFLENGVLSRFSFSNAVIAGLNLKEYDWVQRFIRDNSPSLEEKHRRNYVDFYTARLHYEQREYREAMKLFAHFEYDDILMNLQAKTMLLKMYFELDESLALDSLIDSMSAYIQRKKLMGYHKDIYRNLLLYTRRMLRVNPGNAAQVARLRAEVEKAEPLMEKKWLLAQIDNL